MAALSRGVQRAVARPSHLNGKLLLSITKEPRTCGVFCLMNKQSVSIRVTGRVQGVWFRASAKKEAERLGLTGFVRNEADNSVFIEVEGAPANLNAFVAWCHEGPVHAKVNEVVVNSINLRGYSGFEITR